MQIKSISSLHIYKEPLHTIIKNIRSNDETTKINTNLSDHVVVREENNTNVFDVSIMNYHSPPTNASITEPGVANKYNNSTIMINSDDDNKISLFGKPKYTHDSKTTQQNSSNSIKNTNSRDLPKLLNPYTPNDKRLYNHHHMGSHENKAIHKNDHYNSLQEGQIKYIRLNSLSKLSHKSHGKHNTILERRYLST